MYEVMIWNTKVCDRDTGYVYGTGYVYEVIWDTGYVYEVLGDTGYVYKVRKGLGTRLAC